MNEGATFAAGFFLVLFSMTAYGIWLGFGPQSKTLTDHYDIKTPKTKGVQQLSPGDVNTNYISEGGYCMFYVRQALNYLVKEKESKSTTDLTKLANKLSQKKFYTSVQSPFSTSKSIEKKSVELASMYL